MLFQVTKYEHYLIQSFIQICSAVPKMGENKHFSDPCDSIGYIKVTNLIHSSAADYLYVVSMFVHTFSLSIPFLFVKTCYYTHPITSSCFVCCRVSYK